MVSKYENLLDEARGIALTKQAEDLLELAIGNILRVLANGGETRAVYHQMEEALTALDYLDEAKPYATDGIFSRLRSQTRITPDLFDSTSPSGRQSEVIRQSLRIVAGHMLGDNTRASIANQKLDEAIKRYNKDL